MSDRVNLRALAPLAFIAAAAVTGLAACAFAAIEGYVRRAIDRATSGMAHLEGDQ